MGWENITVIVAFCCVRWEELGNGEADASECIAGIFCIAAALFLRNAEAVCGNQHLHIPLQLNNREQSYRNSNCSRVAALNKLARKASSYAVRNAGNISNIITTIAWMT